LNGALSPDEKWMAYQSNEGGRSGVRVRPFPDPHSGKSPLFFEGGFRPEWRDEGREIFFRAKTGRGLVEMAVSATPGAKGLELGTPRIVWQLGSGVGNPEVAITRDGKRALVTRPVPATNTQTPLTVVVNWQEELKQRVPTR
jgi:hypothetical protein